MMPYLNTDPRPRAYVYEADYHCPDCARARYGSDEYGNVPPDARDREGNAVGALFRWDAWHDCASLDLEPGTTCPAILECSDCGAELDSCGAVWQPRPGCPVCGSTCGVADCRVCAGLEPCHDCRQKVTR